MGKLLSTKDYILISAAIVGEVFENLRLVGDVVPWVYKTRYGFIPDNYKKQTYLSTVSRMLSSDLIERKIGKNGEPYLELTSTGSKEFKRRFPIFAVQKNKWDGNFMQVIFDIPEKERKIRQTLRIKLKELGFGMIQESVFISPYHFENDLAEFLSINGFTDYVYVMTVKAILVGDFSQLGAKVWGINDLSERYKNILSEFDQKLITKNELREKYFTILESDPFLPKEFLPSDWKREVVAKLAT